MKFEAPVVDVKKFDLVDVLTTSGGSVTPTQQQCDYNTEGPCPDD